MISTDPLIWMQVILFLSLCTIVWKDTPISKYAEQIYLGTFTAHLLVMGWQNINSVGVTKLLAGDIVYLIPIILSFLAFTRYSKKYGWLSRYSIALIVGVGIGTSTRAMIAANITDQIKDSFLPLYVSGDFFGSVNNIVFVALFMSSLGYFIFTMKRFSGASFNKFTLLGRYAMMAAFGYGFSSTIVIRINSAVQAFKFVIKIWLGIGI